VILVALVATFLLAALGTLLYLVLHNRSGVAAQTTSSSSGGFTATPSATDTAAPTPSPTAPPTQPPVPTAAPTSPASPRASPVEVAGALFPGPGPACGAQSGNYPDVCPLTPELAQKLVALYNANPRPPYEPLCRCASVWTAVTYAQTGDDTVRVTFTFGSRKAEMRVTMLQVQGGWVASDTTCSGSSMLAEPNPKPCQGAG
jgi:hypothetical protein